MHRTQIYLDDEIYAFLQAEKKRRCLSFSEIIRMIIKENLGADTTTQIRRMKKAIGSWPYTDETPSVYVDRMRRDRRP